MKIAIIMGSDSDLPVMREAAAILEQQFGLVEGEDFEVTIVSAHRTPMRLYEYAQGAVERGIKVIIAGAGGAAHLPGMTASIVAIPVIGVPIKTSTLSGVDSLYSITQMPPGIPVATMAINGAKNAAIMAVTMLGMYDSELYEKVVAYKTNLGDEVVTKALKMEKMRSRAYLQQMEANR